MFFAKLMPKGAVEDCIIDSPFIATYFDFDPFFDKVWFATDAYSRSVWLKLIIKEGRME